MSPSTFPTASASATSGISGLNTHPAGSLCTLRSRRRRRPRNTRYRATRYRLTRAGLPPAGTRQLRLAHWNDLRALLGEPEPLAAAVARAHGGAWLLQELLAR